MKIDRGDKRIKVNEFFDMVESRQRTLNANAEEDMELKHRSNKLDVSVSFSNEETSHSFNKSSVSSNFQNYSEFQ